MKKIIRLAMLLIIVICCSSCIDYVQSITYKDGKWHFYCKVTVSKILFAMGNEFGNNGSDTFGNDDSFRDNLPGRANTAKIDTDLDYGYEVNINIEPHTTNDDLKKFLPTTANNKVFIPFFLEQNSDMSGIDNYSTGDTESAMSSAMLSSAKCRILIGKNIIPSAKTAYFKSDKGENVTIPIYDYGCAYCAEVPFILLTNRPEGLQLDKLVIE